MAPSNAAAPPPALENICFNNYCRTDIMTPALPPTPRGTIMTAALTPIRSMTCMAPIPRERAGVAFGLAA